MTDQITVPKQTWDAMREALEEAVKGMGGSYLIWSVKAESAITAANAVQPQAQEKAWVWNPASTEWEGVRAFGHWQQGAIYAFGQTQPEPLAHPQATEPAWRPIESAPRNGTLILLATDGGIVFVGKLNKHLQLWVDDEGRERFRTVTYWMPLPAAPEAHHGK